MKPLVAWPASFWGDRDPNHFQGRKVAATILQSKRGENRLGRKCQEFYRTFKKQIHNNIIHLTQKGKRLSKDLSISSQEHNALRSQKLHIKAGKHLQPSRVQLQGFLWEKCQGAGFASSQEISHQHLHWASRQASSTKKVLMTQKVFVQLNFRTMALLELGTCMVKAAEELGSNWQQVRR